MATTITAPITISTQTVSAPITISTETISAPLNTQFPAVVLAHVAGDGSDHEDVVTSTANNILDETHRLGDGTDHSAIPIIQAELGDYWRDIDFPIVIRTTGPAIPTLETLQGNITAPQWQVNDVNVCEGQEFVHDWVEGTECFWHCHIITNGSEGVNKYIRFEVEYCIANPNGTLSAAQTITGSDKLIPAGTEDKTHFIYSIGSFTPSTTTITAHTYARLKRVASVGAAPSSNPWCSMLQMHIQTDGWGSTTMTSK